MRIVPLAMDAKTRRNVHRDHSRLNPSEFRQESGISLEQVAYTTKIRLHYLQAIECGDFNSLPRGIFRTCYVRQYAQVIGFDEGILLARYRSTASSETTLTDRQLLAHLVEARLRTRPKRRKWRFLNRQPLPEN